MESFEKHLHDTRVNWLGYSGKKKIDAIELMAKIDSDAVVKMKTIGRQRVSKGLSTAKELEEFFNFVDEWLAEISGATFPELAVWQKIGVMTYAHTIAP